MFISYAQNLEDVLLWRCFKDLENGTYIDVGANDPSEDSVTKAFYDRGWSGINIEPIPRHYDDLTAQRPRDINLRVAAGDKQGEMEIVDVPAIRGWATMDEAVALAIEDSGHEVVRSKTPVRTLNDICAEHNCNEIHFLKIDVEGFEGRVIQGIDLKKIKPWVLLVEAYCANKGRIDNEDWEPYVLGAGYKLAFFDGLNCFYVSKDHKGLLPLFDKPVNVFDDYIRHGHLEATEKLGTTSALLSNSREELATLTAEFQHSATEAAANLAEASTSVTILTAEVLSKQNTIEENEAEIQQKTESLKSAKIELQRKDEAIAKAESKLRIKEEAIDKTEAKVRQKDEVIEKAEAKILQKDEVIEKAEAKILQKDEVIEKAEAKIRQKDEVIEKLDDKTKHLQRELVGLREQTELDKKAADALVAQAQELNHSSHHWYVHSQTVEQELDAANLALHAVKSSVSWRLTWPLRKLYELIRFITLTFVALLTFIIKSPWYFVRACLLSLLWCIRLSPKTAALLERVIKKVPVIHRYPMAMGAANPAPRRVEVGSLADTKIAPLSEAADSTLVQPDAGLCDSSRRSAAIFSNGGEKVLYYYIDHTAACPVNTGMQRVVRQLANALLASGETVIFVKWSDELSSLALADLADLQYLQKWNGPDALLNAPVRYPDEGCHEPIPIDQGVEQLVNWLVVPEVPHINYHNKPLTLEIIMQAKASGCKTAFIFYDATPLRREELKGMAGSHALYMQHLLLADLLLPISKASAEDLESFFRISELASDISMPRIATVPLAGEKKSVQRAVATSTLSRCENMILSVGSIGAHKNQMTLIEAFLTFYHRYPNTDWKLVLVGHVAAAEHHQLQEIQKDCKAIEVLSGLSDAELGALYQSAAFTIFPSVMEGFGLPILESLWYGKPCICANFGAMAEVAEGGGCLTIDTRNSGQICNAIVKLVSSESLYQQLTAEAVSRNIESWAGYTEKLNEQFTEVGNSLNHVGAVFYVISQTCQYPSNSGIQRVARGLARSLIENGLKLVPVLFDANANQFIPASPEQLSHMSRWNGPPVDGWSDWIEPAECSPRDWLLCAELTHLYTAALLTAAKRVQLRAAYVFYDTIPYKLKDMYPPEATEAHRCYMEALNDCELVFPISQFSEKDLVCFLGASSLQTPDLHERMRACVLPGEFMENGRILKVERSDPADQAIKILCVGTVEPRKNHLTLIRAFQSVKSQCAIDVELVLAGGDVNADLTLQVEEYITNTPGLTWEKSPDDDQLRSLYARCDFTVYASLEEGFGLPILESIWHAKPCVCHHEGAMHEVASAGGCVPVDATSPERLAAGMVSLIENREYLLALSRECTQMDLKTWHDYGKEIAARMAMERPVPAVSNAQIAAVASKDVFYAQMLNLEKRPLLSICISTYNRAAWMEVGLKNLARVLPECHDEVEIVVCDNASTDNTRSVVQPYLERSDFAYYQNPENVGMLGNLRVTANHAKGQYVWILGDDDLIKPESVERVLTILRSNPELALVYLNYAFHVEDDPKRVGNLDNFLMAATPVAPPTKDRQALVGDISTCSENFFTAIYCIIFRRDHAIKAYSQDTTGRPFSTLLTCIPTTYYVLNHMMQEQGYWMGEPQLVVNMNVSWMRYAPLWILERLPEVHDLAQKMGADVSEVNKIRADHFKNNVPHWFNVIYGEDPEGNIEYFRPERFVSRVKHLKEFHEAEGGLRKVYETAHQGKHPGATLAPDKVFYDVR